MKIGVLELLCEEAAPFWMGKPHNFFVLKQTASIMPQAISVWCRTLGHDVHYEVYYGQKDPARLMPSDLDVLFLCCFSRGSGLAYAISRLFKIKNPDMLTVLGGPHAKQFSEDAIRFFDVVVKKCDAVLIKEILDDFPKGEIVTTDRELSDLPTIEERLPEIRKAGFWKGRPSACSFIPVLSSTGCPYSCDFCVEWDTPYNAFPLERVREDLEYVAANFPQVKINFYDPNFGVRFDRIMSVIESVSHPKKRWFLTEGSLDSLTDDKLERMKDAGCACVIPGIESWTAYSKKSGINRTGSALDKLEKIVERFDAIHEFIPIIQANLLFGLDSDKGRDPVEQNKAFISRTPYVSHTLNIPAPFGETPLYRRYMKKGRILESLPFSFYCKPYLATTLRHYHPIEFYENLIEIFCHMTSVSQQVRAVMTSRSWIFKGYHPVRNLALKVMIRTMRTLLHQLKTDSQFRAFHEGQTDVLPEYYHDVYDRLLGPYRELVSRKDRIPVLKRSGGMDYQKTGS